MKYCTKCGNLLNDDDLFCPKCGTKQLVAKMPEDEPKEIKEEIINEPIKEEKIEDEVIEEVIINDPNDQDATGAEIEHVIDNKEVEILEEKEETEEIISIPDDIPVVEPVEEVKEEIEEEKEVILEPKTDDTDEEIVEVELEEIPKDETIVVEDKVEEKSKENDEVELLKAKIEALEKQVNKKTEVKEEPIVEKEAKPVVKNQNTNDLKATESVIMIVGYTVIFFIYCILNATVLNEGAFIGKLGLLFATGVFFAMFIVKMVKAKNRKLQFLFFMNLTFAIIMGMYIIGNLIILSQS